MAWFRVYNLCFKVELNLYSHMLNFETFGITISALIKDSDSSSAGPRDQNFTPPAEIIGAWDLDANTALIGFGDRKVLQATGPWTLPETSRDHKLVF